MKTFTCGNMKTAKIEKGVQIFRMIERRGYIYLCTLYKSRFFKMDKSQKVIFKLNLN